MKVGEERTGLLKIGNENSEAGDDFQTLPPPSIVLG